MEPVRQIRRQLYAADGRDGIWWLGNAGFAVRLGCHYIFIDPCVTDVHAHVPSQTLVHGLPLPVDCFERADCVLYTHEHEDHMDRKLFAKLVELNSDIWAPEYCREIILDEGVPDGQVHIAAVDHSSAADGYTVEIIRARHIDHFGTGGTDLESQDTYACGYLLKTQYGSIYHPGDTQYLREFDALAVDYLLLPINDSNMGVGYAAQLTSRLQPKVVIPCHYGMWAPAVSYQGGHPAEYLTALAARGYTLPRTDIMILKPGGRVILD